MKKLIKHAALMLLALSITSCGGSSSSSSSNNPPPPPPVTEPPSSLAKFSLGIADASTNNEIKSFIKNRGMFKPMPLLNHRKKGAKGSSAATIINGLTIYQKTEFRCRKSLKREIIRD